MPAEGSQQSRAFLFRGRTSPRRRSSPSCSRTLRAAALRAQASRSAVQTASQPRKHNTLQPHIYVYILSAYVLHICVRLSR
eukprot:11584786-Heterocapsa_arctica.AAC.1